MCKKNLLKCMLSAEVILIIFILPISSSQVTSENVKERLREFDKSSNLSGCKISFIVTREDNQFDDPNQGMIFIDCGATWTSEGNFAMKMTYYYEHPPVFKSVGSRNYRFVDYDNEGNLIVWRTTKEYILNTSERNEMSEEYSIFIVDPNGKVIEKGKKILINRYPLDKPYSSYQFRYFQLPMGRGFSNRLSHVDSVESLPSGLLKLKSSGSSGPGLEGKWEIKLDTSADDLVREAVFTRNGELKPLEIVTSSGVVEGENIKVAKYGTYKSVSGFELSVEVSDVSKVLGTNNLYEEVVSEFNKKLPQGTSIIDLSGESPIRSKIE